MSDYSSYDKAIQAILDAQTDVDNKYKAIGDASSTLCDVNQTIVQVPDGSVTRNRGGDVIGYDYKYTTPQLPDIGIIGVDSNTDTGSFPEASGGGGHTSGGGAGRYRGSYYAGEVVDDPQSTDKAKSTGLVSGLVSSAWAGVSALAKFGKNVAADAGEALATFTENFGQNFGNLCVDLADAQADSIRALFGVDNQGNASMYLDEDTIGALAIQAKNDGFFDRGGDYEEILTQPDDFPSDWVFNPVRKKHADFIGKCNNQITYQNNKACFAATYIDTSSGANVGKAAAIVTSTATGNYSNDIYYFNWVVGNLLYTIFFSPVTATLQQNAAYYTNCAGFGERITIYTRAVAEQSTPTFYNNFTNSSITYNRAFTYDNKTVYIFAFSAGQSINTDYLSEIDYTNANVISSNVLNRAERMAWWALYGDGWITPTSIPGVSDQTGATSPVDAITGADPHVVAQNLESQYPDVMGTPVQVVVMDDSCNSKVINYYKVPISYSPTNLNIGAPITGGLQVSPSFNPDVSLDLPDIDMDNYIDQIIKVLGGSGAGRDVTVEPIPEDDPDAPSDTIPSSGVNYEPPTTGTGDTPPTTDPSVSVESMWHIYHALPAQLSALGQWLWSANIIDQIVRMFQNPMEAIMGVHALYCQPNIGSQVPIVVGNLTSTANAFEVTSQYQVVDCGSVWLTEYFGNVFDYDPFTEVSLYLPFVGIVKLDTADVMRAKIGVIYGVDCYTGACLAKVSVTRDGAGGVLYEFPGNCAVEYPVSGASYSRMLQSIVSAGMSAVHVGLRTGGAPGTAAIGAATAGATFIASGEKSTIQRAGSLGGNAGVFGAKIPYLIISRPQPNTAENFEHYQGIPSNNTVVVNSLSGFQRFESIHLRCPSAYGEELQEIESLLKSGVLI